jgi:Ca2+-binding EF-hand superfamily protein/predicted Ser/Thr protein kinase
MDPLHEKFDFEAFRAEIQIKDTFCFKLYLKNVFEELCLSNNKDSKPTINKLNFYEFLKAPFILSEKIFNIFKTELTSGISYEEFITNMLKLFCGDFEENVKMVFNILDFDQDGCIQKQDTLFLFSFLEIKNYEEIVNTFFKIHGNTQISLTYLEFLHVVENENSDIFILILCFLYELKPFTKSCLLPFKFNQTTYVSNIEVCSNNERKTCACPTLYSRRTNQLLSSKFINFVKDMDHEQECEDELQELESNSSCIRISEGIKIKSNFLFNYDLCENEGNKPFFSTPKFQTLKYQESTVSDPVYDCDIFLCSDETQETNDNSFSKMCGLSNVQQNSEYSIEKNIKNQKIDLLQNSFEASTDIQSKSLKGKILKSPKKLKIPLVKYEFEETLYTFSKKGKLKKYYMALEKRDLFYFSNKEKSELKRMHHLSNCFLRYDECIAQNEQGDIFYAFILIFNNNMSKSKYFCKDKKIFMKWIKVLKDVLNYKDINDHYSFQTELGKGKFGTVLLGQSIQTKKTVAIKQINKNELTPEEIMSIKTEIEILRHCQHERILRFHEYFETYNKIFIITEYINGGSLTDYLSTQTHLLKETQIREIFKQIAEGVKHLHNNGIIHRDLKPDNILIQQTFNQKIEVKISDFGLSKILGPLEKTSETTGTLSHISPEIINNQPYGRETDIWSMGVILHYLISGKLPFTAKNGTFTELTKNITTKPIDTLTTEFMKCSKNTLYLLENCLIKESKKRICLDQILTHLSNE